MAKKTSKQELAEAAELVKNTVVDAVLEAKNAILARFDKEILEWDFYPVLQRFRGEYKSIFRIFNSQYRNDLRCLNSFM